MNPLNDLKSTKKGANDSAKDSKTIVFELSKRDLREILSINSIPLSYKKFRKKYKGIIMEVTGLSEKEYTNAHSFSFDHTQAIKLRLKIDDAFILDKLA